VNGSDVGKLMPSAKMAVLQHESGLSVTSARRTRMNLIGTVFPFLRNGTLKGGARRQPITEKMQQQVTVEVQVCNTV
jgi:hypothetical protein